MRWLTALAVRDVNSNVMLVILRPLTPARRRSSRDHRSASSAATQCFLVRLTFLSSTAAETGFSFLRWLERIAVHKVAVGKMGRVPRTGRARASEL